MTVLETQSLGEGTDKVISPGGAEPGRWPRAELHSRFPSCELAVQRVQSNHFGVKRNRTKSRLQQNTSQEAGLLLLSHLFGSALHSPAPAPMLRNQLPSERATVQGQDCKWQPCHCAGTGELGSCLAKNKCFPA